MFVYPGATSGSPLIPRQGNNKVSTTLTTCCQNGNILYIENTQQCDILPLCFTPITKIFLIFIQDRGLSSIFVIVIFWLSLLSEKMLFWVFFIVYIFFFESWQKLLLVVGQILGHRVLRNHLSASDLIGTLTADQMVSNIGHSWDQVYRTITRTYGMHFMIRTVCNTLCHIQTVTLTLRWLTDMASVL